MPAELLLLLIVAFANPSCQVLSSLRMGEAPAPCLLRNSPSRLLLGRHTSTKVLWCLVLLLWTQESSYPAIQPQIQESRPFIPIPASTREATNPRPHSYPFSGPRNLAPPNSCLLSAAILDDQTVCGRGERLALALAREQINGIIEVPAKARVEVDIFELQRDSQYETTDTSERGPGGCGVRQSRRGPQSVTPALASSAQPCTHLLAPAPFLSACVCVTEVAAAELRGPGTEARGLKKNPHWVRKGILEQGRLGLAAGGGSQWWRRGMALLTGPRYGSSCYPSVVL